ncbi:MAG: enoyl-CoA hydratase [Pseudomonadota bacterium]
MNQTILTEQHDDVLIIKFNRPEKKNAITSDMYRILTETLVNADQNPHIRAIILAGNGDCFTAGNDLQDFLHNPPIDSHSPVLKFLHALSTVKTVLIASIHGSTIGVGATILLHCDLVYAASNTKIRFPFVDLGLCPEAASSLLLPAMVGHLKASQAILLGDTLDAHTAHAWGLINEVVDPNDLPSKALQIAQKIAAKPAAALRLSKSLLKNSISGSITKCIDEEAAAFSERLKSVEAKEAMTAFFQKRAPNFKQFD